MGNDRFTDEPGSVQVTNSHAAHSLGQRIIHGTSWMAFGGIVNKVTTLFTQVIVAMYLLPSEYGVASIALSCRSIAFLFSSGGFHDLLVSRPKTFKRDAPVILQLVVALHLAAALILLVLAFPIEAAVETPGLSYAIIVVALILPIQAVPSVYVAKLKIDERFSVASLCGIVVNVVLCASAICLAIGGAGEYALLLPLLGSAIASAIIHRIATGGLGWSKLQLGRWPSLVGDAKWLLLTAFVTSLEASAIPFFLASRGFNSADIGIFAFGIVLTVQATQLFGINLRAVLVPALANQRLVSTEEMQSRRVQLLLSYSTWLIVPICALQIIWAKPVTETILPTRWQGIESVIAVLSIAIAFEPMKLISSSYLTSSQRFGRNCALRLTAAGIVVLAILICPPQTGLLGLAYVVSGAWIAGSLACTSFGMPLGKARIRKLASMIGPPMICGIVLTSIARSLASLWEHDIGQASIWTASFLTSYCVALRMLAPALFDLLLEQGVQVAKRLYPMKRSVDFIL